MKNILITLFIFNISQLVFASPNIKNVETPGVVAYEPPMAYPESQAPVFEVFDDVTGISSLVGGSSEIQSTQPVEPKPPLQILSGSGQVEGLEAYRLCTEKMVPERFNSCLTKMGDSKFVRSALELCLADKISTATGVFICFETIADQRYHSSLLQICSSFSDSNRIECLKNISGVTPRDNRYKICNDATVPSQRLQCLYTMLGKEQIAYLLYFKYERNRRDFHIFSDEGSEGVYSKCKEIFRNGFNRDDGISVYRRGYRLDKLYNSSSYWKSKDRVCGLTKNLFNNVLSSLLK